MARAKKVFLVAIAAELLMLGLIYVAAAGHPEIDPTAVTGDMKSFRLLAYNLATNKVFSHSLSAPFYPESFRSPGFPAIISFFYFLSHSWIIVLLLYIFLAALTPLLLYLTTRKFGEDPAYIGALLFAVEPNRLWTSATLLSEMLFTLLVLLSIYVVTRDRLSWQRVGASGALLGYAILTRPVAFLIPLIFTIYYCWSTQSLKRGLSFGVVTVACTLLVISPWMYRNHTTFGSWQVSSVGAFNMAYYNANEFYRQQHGVYAVEKPTTTEGLSLTHLGDFNSITGSILKGHIVAYSIFHVVKTVPFFFTDGYRDIVRLLGVSIGPMPNISGSLLKGDWRTPLATLLADKMSAILFLGGFLFWFGVVVCMCYGTYVFLRHSDAHARAFAILCSLLIFSLAVLTGPVSNARYRVPVSGFMIWFAVSGLYFLYERRTRPTI